MKGDDTYNRLTAKTVKDDGASENYVRSATIQQLSEQKKGAV